jgi:CspA family cold shock protein
MTMTGEIAFGTVTFFNVERGFGFIAPADGGPAVFIHINRCWNSEPLEKGWRVRFKAEDTARGPRATWVEVVS